MSVHTLIPSVCVVKLQKVQCLKSGVFAVFAVQSAKEFY